MTKRITQTGMRAYTKGFVTFYNQMGNHSWSVNDDDADDIGICFKANEWIGA